MDFPSLPTYFFYSWTIFVKNCWQRLWLLPTSEDHGSNPVVGRRKRKRGRERPILKYLDFWLEQVFFAAVALTRDLSLAGTSAVSVEQCPTTLLYSMELLSRKHRHRIGPIVKQVWISSHCCNHCLPWTDDNYFSVNKTRQLITLLNSLSLLNSSMI